MMYPINAAVLAYTSENERIRLQVPKITEKGFVGPNTTILNCVKTAFRNMIDKNFHVFQTPHFAASCCGYACLSFLLRHDFDHHLAVRFDLFKYCYENQSELAELLCNSDYSIIEYA